MKETARPDAKAKRELEKIRKELLTQLYNLDAVEYAHRSFLSERVVREVKRGLVRRMTVLYI